MVELTGSGLLLQDSNGTQVWSSNLSLSSVKLKIELVLLRYADALEVLDIFEGSNLKKPDNRRFRFLTVLTPSHQRSGTAEVVVFFFLLPSANWKSFQELKA
ncbi:hypothetical protein Q3G72_021044 [Acer saccharum]|nr:hypothetical protein Q3G72_021044 [Acer saccharum]